MVVGLFRGLLAVGVGVSLTLSPALVTPFLLLSFLAQTPCEGLCLVLLCPVLFDVPERLALFWKESAVWRGVDLGQEVGERTGGVEGG